VAYKFIYPTLECICCFRTSSRLIAISNDNYVQANTSTNQWYNDDFVSSSASLIAHHIHISSASLEDIPMLLHATYSKQALTMYHCKPLPDNVKRIVSLMHDCNHYAVMEVILSKRMIKVYNVEIGQSQTTKITSYSSSRSVCSLNSRKQTSSFHLWHPLMHLSEEAGSRQPMHAVICLLF
jgi:hypothetical protein